MIGFVNPGAWVLTLSAFASLSAAQDWVEIETPHFLLLSNADPRTARNVALEFEQAREVFRLAISSDLDPGLPIVIFAVRNRTDLKLLLPGMGNEMPIGVFLDSPDRHRIALRLDEPSGLRFQTIYHEYHHLLFRSAVGRAPVWLIEGLAEFWSTMEGRAGDKVEIGRPSSSHLRTLHLGSMMPLRQLLQFEGRVHELPVEQIAIIYAQSWAVVHYLMLGKGGSGRAALDRYTSLVDNGGDPVDAFEQVYGSTRAIEQELLEYLDQTMFPAMTTDVPDPPPASEFRVRELLAAEVSAAIGGFIVTGPWPQEALGHLERALELDPESSAAMEGIGFLHFRQGELEAAETWFEKVADVDATSYLAHYYLGMLAMRRMGEPSTIETRLKRAIELNPKFAPALVALSGYLAEDELRLGEALDLAQTATRLAPESASAWENLANILVRSGRPEDAQRAAQRASGSRTP